MMVGEDFILADDETGAEEVFLNFGSAALQAIDHVSVAIFERLAVGIDRTVTQRAVCALVEEGNRNVQQADAGGVGANDAFGCVGLRFYFFQAVRCLIQLFAEAGDFASIGGGKPLPKIVGLFLELPFLLGDV